MKAVIIFLLFLHGILHLVGFAKAFLYSEEKKSIQKPQGILWLITALVIILSGICYLARQEYWWALTAPGLILSQYLIIRQWKIARFGTIVNIILISITIVGWATWNFYQSYHRIVVQQLQTNTENNGILSEKDLNHLPEPVKKYIRRSGSLGKPKVQYFMVEFTGKIRKNEQSEWMSFHSEQYNFMKSTQRLFFMNATMKHLPVEGFHYYDNGSAFMDIRLFSLLRVQKQTGREMGIAETVTFFNDMCCLAPATLIDPRVEWLEVKGNVVKAAFHHHNIHISAWLYFNEQGELINFISNDRYASMEDGTLKRLRWSTPLYHYKNINGHYLPGYAETLYAYPEGDFCYGTFQLTNVEYNGND